MTLLSLPFYAPPWAHRIKWMVALLLLSAIAAVVPNGCRSQGFANGDSTLFSYDPYTYGIWYNAGIFPGDLTIPVYPSARSTATQTNPQIYWVSPTNTLHIFFKGADYIIGPGGGGGGLTAAANGLQTTTGDSAILGYSQVTPNLYQSVDIKTGFTAFGINADSDFILNDGTDTTVGSFLGVGNSVNQVVPAIMGWQDPVNGFMNEVQMDNGGLGYLWSMFSPGGDYDFFELDHDYFSWQSNSPDYFQIYEGVGELGTTTFELHLQPGPAGPRSAGQIDYWDNINTQYISHLSGAADSLAGYAPYGPAISALNGVFVVSDTTTYVSGNDLDFTVRIGMRSVGVSTDSVVLGIQLEAPSANAFTVMVSAAVNQASGAVLSAIQPYIVPTSNSSFLLCGAVPGGVAAQFTGGVNYYFTFHVLDCTALHN